MIKLTYASYLWNVITNNLVINLMSDINEIRELSSSYAVWLIILPVISSFCYQFDGIFIGASQTKELRNAMIFSVFSYLLISILLISITLSACARDQGALLPTGLVDINSNQANTYQDKTDQFDADQSNHSAQLPSWQRSA